MKTSPSRTILRSEEIQQTADGTAECKAKPELQESPEPTHSALPDQDHERLLAQVKEHRERAEALARDLQIERTRHDELQQRMAEVTANLTEAVTSLRTQMLERERVEAALRESEAQLRLLIEQVPAVIWTTDKDLKYTSTEGAGLAALKIGPNELIGKYVTSTGKTGSPEAKAVLRSHQRALTGESVAYRSRWGESYFEGYVEPLRGPDGEINGCIGVAMDISERVHSEMVRREREEQYRSIFESTSDGMVIATLDGRIVDANPAACRMSGYPYEEFIGLESTEFIRTDERDSLKQLFQTVRRGRQLERQAVGVRKDGTQFNLELRATRLRRGGEPHALLVIQDISERIRSYQLLEQRVRERTRELSSLLAFSRQASATLDVRRLMDLVVEEVARLVDATDVGLFVLEGNVLKMAAQRKRPQYNVTWDVRIVLDEPDMRWIFQNKVGAILVSDLSKTRDVDPLRRVGSAWLGQGELPRSIMWVPLVIKQTVIGGLSIAHVELNMYSERDAGLVQAIASQAAVAIENARLYEQAHEFAVLQERQRLARELHDSVTQSLYSLSLMAEAARRMISTGKVERGAGYLGRIGESAQQVLKEMRLLVYELRPLILERDGLASALKQRLETVEDRSGVATSLIVNGSGLVPEYIEAELYRIAQEALNNSLKHSGASSVKIQLCTTPEEITLTVSDNGRGFSAGSIEDTGGLGFVTMRERTQRLGGRLDVVSAPGEGASVKVWIPVANPGEK